MTDTTPQTEPRAGCPTPGCAFGHLHTGICRTKAGTALVGSRRESVGIHPAGVLPVGRHPADTPPFIPEPRGPELVPYTAAQQRDDLRRALETPCNCGQPHGHLIGCPRRVAALHEHVAESIARGEIDAPLTLGTEAEGLLYVWFGALLGWTVLRTGTLSELFPGGLTLAHRCGAEINLPDNFRVPDMIATAVAHVRECGR